MDRYFDKNGYSDRNRHFDKSSCCVDKNGYTEMVSEYCCLVNQTFGFIEDYFEGVVPAGHKDEAVCERTRVLYNYEDGVPAEILEEYLAFASDYFKQGNPRENIECNRRECRNIVLNTVQMIANLTVCLAQQEEPCACLVRDWLELDGLWRVHSVHSGYELANFDEISLKISKSSFQIA